MRFLLILFIAFSLTLAWQSSVLAVNIEKQNPVACEKNSLQGPQGQMVAGDEAIGYD